MDKHVVRMIAQHRQLVARIEALDKYIYSDKSANDSKAELINKCIQLKAMRVYEEALCARLANAGVEYAEPTKEYFERITFGNDFDVDKEKNV